MSNESRRFPSTRPTTPLAIGVIALLASGSSYAQLRWSFLDSAQSVVKYTEATAKPIRSCSSLLGYGTPDVSIISVQVIPADGEAPEHCRVFALIQPEIRVWINLPTAWNNRLYAIGEGDFGGHSSDLPIFALWQARALRNGFTTAYNDTGHDGRFGGPPFFGSETKPMYTAVFANNNLERQVDFGFRAAHLTSVLAKRLIEVFYGKKPSYAYFDGCSTGGRQAMVEAQRFPHDYDGVVAGAPPFDMTGLFIQIRQTTEALHKININPGLLEVLGKAIYKRCDGVDGLEDGVLRDPRQCDFDPARDLPRCTGGPSDACFTSEQIEGVKLLYAPVVVDGKRIHPGAPLGAEPKDPDGRSGWVPEFMNVLPDGRVGPSVMELHLVQWLRYLAFEVSVPDMQWQDFDLKRDIPKLKRTREVEDATDPDLSPFAAAGGKLIAYHGWADIAPNALRTAEYFDEVQRTMGAHADSTARLFMVPGMFHCSGGYNVDRLDAMTALINWRERGVAPKQIVATRIRDGKVVRSQPVCSYPKVAAYLGKGDPLAAENFGCVDPPASIGR